MQVLPRKTIHDVDVSGQTVLVRVDFNVPLDDGRVADDTRIRASLPTLNYLRERGCRLILMTHLGRPKGQAKEELRLDPVARRLEELTGWPVVKVDQVVGPQVAEAVAQLPPGGILLLENLRFDPREEEGSPELAQELAALGSLYVNDAFGTAHRAHASTAVVARFLPAVAGLLMARELEVLDRLLSDPQRPFWAIIGGAKVGDKLGVLQALVQVCDGIAVGGGMANTFLAAQGGSMGDSLVEADRLEEARAIMAAAAQRGCRFLLPTDLVAASAFAPDADKQVCPAGEVPDGWQALDVGPETVAAFGEALAEAKTVFWNGPLGVFEWPAFAEGTVAVARTLAHLEDAVVVVGGGDSAAAVVQAGVADAIDHISTGGGATLEYIEGRSLPGVEVLAVKEAGEG
ncbi:MAG TPA: phosphoglycerate kinase [Sphingobacteriaceae bacterium]|nr:phosphoglycerate kinase [Sphingobacteriaceae bacterium]